MTDSFTFSALPVVLKPQGFLGDKPSETGYWGFVRSLSDYEDELRGVSAELDEAVGELNKRGYSISLGKPLEISTMDELMASSEELRKAHLVILLPMGPVRLYQSPDVSVISALLSFVDYVVVYDKFGQHIYAGTLFAPPLLYNLAKEAPDLARRVVLAEGDLDTVKSTMRVVYALEKLKRATLVMVGEPNDGFGGWTTLAKGMSRFGFKVRHVTYGQFADDFEKRLKDPKYVEDAKKVADEYVNAGKADDDFRKKYELPQPDEDRKVRAGIYYLTLRDYLNETPGSDWITVNCLNANALGKVRATPCMSHSIMNDQGLVATCEADPTAMIIHYLMRWIANKPVGFYDPTVNVGEGKLMLAHCTSPTKMKGYDQPPLKYVATTHHESNTSVAPKVLYEPGVVTMAGFSYDLGKMISIRADATGPDFLRVCRDQIEARVGNAKAALEGWQGFHWVMAYGDHVKDLELLANLTGMQLIEVT